MKLGSSFVLCFYSLFLLFVGFDRAQYAKGLEMQKKHLGSRVKPNNVLGQGLFNIKQSSFVHSF